MSIYSEMIRATWSINDAKRNAIYRTPESIERFDDIRYGPHAANVLDVYRRKDQGELVRQGQRLPVIISVHGGAWVYGDKELYQFYCMDLAERGFAVVNYTYRLAPESKFPAQIEDTNLVVQWVLDHGEEYGLDTAHVYMVGDSAGANLLGLYTAFCTDPAYAAEYPFAPIPGFVPRAIALNCGSYQPYPTDGTRGDTSMQQLMKDLLPDVHDLDALRRIDVTAHVNQGFPPMYIMSASGDQQVPQEQAQMLIAACKESGARYTYVHYGDEENALWHVFHLTIQNDTAMQCNGDECAFFRMHWKG